MREEIYSYTLFNRLWHYQCADVLVSRKGCSYKIDREPLSTSSKQSRKANKDLLSEKVPKPYTYTDYFKWHEHELTSTLLFLPQDVHTKIELFTINSFP